MSDVLDEGSGGRVDPTSSLFQREWQTYRKMVDNNYLFHREAYGRLRELLLAEVARPFRFLDIACGDASATAGALAGTPIAHYAGIDLSIPALEIARSTLTTLSCPITLHHRDFCEALREWSEPADIVWIGLSLHHLHAREKCSVMRDVRRILRDDGILLIYENTSRMAKSVPPGCDAGMTNSRPGPRSRRMSGMRCARMSGRPIIPRRFRAGARSAGAPDSGRRDSCLSRRRISSGCGVSQSRTGAFDQAASSA